MTKTNRFNNDIINKFDKIKTKYENKKDIILQKTQDNKNQYTCEYARYGNEYIYIDVTDIVNNLMKNKITNFTVNDILFSDSSKKIKMKNKILVLLFLNQLKIHIPENYVVSIDYVNFNITYKKEKEKEIEKSKNISMEYSKEKIFKLNKNKIHHTNNSINNSLNQITKNDNYYDLVNKLLNKSKSIKIKKYKIYNELLNTKSSIDESISNEMIYNKLLNTLLEKSKLPRIKYIKTIEISNKKTNDTNHNDLLNILLEKSKIPKIKYIKTNEISNKKTDDMHHNDLLNILLEKSKIPKIKYIKTNEISNKKTNETLNNKTNYNDLLNILLEKTKIKKIKKNTQSVESIKNESENNDIYSNLMNLLLEKSKSRNLSKKKVNNSTLNKEKTIIEMQNTDYNLTNVLLEKSKIRKIRKIKDNKSNIANEINKTHENISYISYKKVKKTFKNIIQNNIYIKKIKELTNYEVNNINIEILEDIVNNKNDKIIISLTTIPSRFVSDDFDIMIESLINQTLSPDHIIINICKEYKRQFEYDDMYYKIKLENFCSNYQNVHINKCNDYGPGTKILGLCEFKEFKINPNDIIIITDDDLIYKPNMTYHYAMVYQLYQCECIGIAEENVAPWIDNNIKNNNKYIYYDNYDTYLYGWLSWSIKYRNIDGLLEYYNGIVKLDENIWKHDDLIFTMYYKKKQLYTCGINLFFLMKQINNNNELRLDNMINANYRKMLETLYFQKNTKCTYKINKNIKERYLLYNVQNINYLPENINYNEKHIDIKYINKYTFALTLTSYNNNDKRIYKIDNNNLFLEAKYNKQTFFYNSNVILIKEDHYHINYNIFQTSISNILTLNKLYSICSILSNIPSCEYLFFDDNDIINYINTNYPKCINLYNNIIPGAYKADFFRLLYAYDNGGIYFDCKQILFSKESTLFNYDNLFIEDIEKDGIYNAFFMTDQHNENIYNIMIQCINNLIKTTYSESPLSITGPQLWKKYINKNECELKNILFTPETYYDIKDRFLYSHIINKTTNEIMIKNSYYGYYFENNYLSTIHYSNLWNLKQVYHKHIDAEYYNKINNIDYILWINLDRSDKRRKSMEAQLKYINIPAIRISGIDGKNNKLENLTNVTNDNMTIYEHCCLFSHLKTILHASSLDGNNFLILEDDAVFDNFVYFNSLEEIINNAPEFDILMIYKTTEDNLINTYTYRTTDNILGTVAYIINKKGINKITKLFEYNEKFTFFENNIAEADRYIYNNTITCVYKYNLIYETSNDSLIHSKNLPFHKKVLELDTINIINDNLIYHLPKIIFSYWDPYNDVIYAHFQNWKNKISNEWKIIILNKTNLNEYIDIQFINKYINLDATRFSDFIRLYLLIKYGGVWMDASIIITNGDFLDNYHSEMINKKYDICIYENKKESCEYPHLDNWFFMAPRNCNYLYDLYNEFNKSYEMDFINYKNEILLKTNINFENVFSSDNDTYLMQHAIAKYLLYTKHTYKFNIKYASASMFYIQENNPIENTINIIISNDKLLSSLYAIKLTHNERKYITSENKYIYINKLLHL